MSISNNADFFLNFQQFGELKLQARNQSADASVAVARQFEGLFLQQMLTAMRAASRIDAEQHSSYVDFYLEMHDKQLAQTMSQQGYLGVAKLIMQQLPAKEANALPVEAPGLKLQATRAAVSETGLVHSNKPASAIAATTLPADRRFIRVAAHDAVVLNKIVDDDFAEVDALQKISARWQQPHHFVADIWPQAEQAAKALGVSPALLVAQSALETGWGRHTIKYDDGRSSYNLFGIKAGAHWNGAVVSRASLEFDNGVLQNQVSRFRAYATPAQSLADYVDYIQSNPRYRAALAAGGNDQAYINEIHDAGYATDPDYASKVMTIRNGEILQGALTSLDTGVSRNV